MYRGFYINMDEEHGRRTSLETQLNALGIAGRYRRFPGEIGDAGCDTTNQLSPGELGCWLSHTTL